MRNEYRAKGWHQVPDLNRMSGEIDNGHGCPKYQSWDASQHARAGPTLVSRPAGPVQIGIVRACICIYVIERPHTILHRSTGVPSWVVL